MKLAFWMDRRWRVVKVRGYGSFLPHGESRKWNIWWMWAYANIILSAWAIPVGWKTFLKAHHEEARESSTYKHSVCSQDVILTSKNQVYGEYLILTQNIYIISWGAPKQPQSPKKEMNKRTCKYLNSQLDLLRLSDWEDKSVPLSL